MRAKLFRQVPFARSGPQEYLGSELGLEGNGVVTVDRPELEVAKSAPTFEGVPLTMDHPGELMKAEDVDATAVGLASDVTFADGYLRADLLLWDEKAIRAVSDGIRELSAGYEAEYQKDGAAYRQQDIQGNHIAIVPVGRAGSAVRIR